MVVTLICIIPKVRRRTYVCLNFFTKESDNETREEANVFIIRCDILVIS